MPLKFYTNVGVLETPDRMIETNEKFRDTKLAYLEPLCTVPEYRRMGLASAALSELYRRTVTNGATHMTGGTNDFYFAIGYEGILKRSVWRKK